MNSGNFGHYSVDELVKIISAEYPEIDKKWLTVLVSQVSSTNSARRDLSLEEKKDYLINNSKPPIADTLLWRDCVGRAFDIWHQYMR